MEKILELEKKLIEYKEELGKAVKAPPKSYKPVKPTTVPKNASPPAGTEKKPMPIGEKGSLKVSHTGSDPEGDHHFDIHRDGKRIGGANTNMGSDGKIDIGSGHERAPGHTDDQHDEESSHIENIIENHVKQHPKNYPAPVKKSIDDRLDNLLDKAIRDPAIFTGKKDKIITARYQDGDPRHALEAEAEDSDRSMHNRKSGKMRQMTAEMDTEGKNKPDGKLKGFTSGTSMLRHGIKKTDMMKNNNQWELEKAVSIKYIGPKGSGHDYHIMKDGKKVADAWGTTKPAEGDNSVEISQDLKGDDRIHSGKLISDHVKSISVKKSLDNRIDDLLEKGLGKDLEANASKERVKHALGSIRPSATVTDLQGKVTEVSPGKQVSDKATAESQKKANAKAKAESEAAIRRKGYKKEGLMKNHLQWDLSSETLEKGAKADRLEDEGSTPFKRVPKSEEFFDKPVEERASNLKGNRIGNKTEEKEHTKNAVDAGYKDPDKKKKEPKVKPLDPSVFQTTKEMHE